MLIFISVASLFIAQMVWWILFFHRIVDDHPDLARYRVMLLLEGAFFALLILVGLWLIYLTLRQQIRMKRQAEDFFATFSHELKSPLASIRLQLETLAERELAKEIFMKLLNNMEQDLERLQLSIDNILDIYSLESKGFSLQKEKVVISDWISRTIDYLSSGYVAEGMRIERDLECRAEVAIDPRAFETVVGNLLQNAHRYGGENKRLHVSAEESNGRVEISFRDEGIGFEPGKAGKLFDKFYRIPHENGTCWKGAGLGLYLTKMIVEAHGGSITAHSAGPGKGSEFIIELPKDD